MRNVTYFFSNRSFKVKVLTYFILLILIPTFIITALGNVIYKRSVENEAEVYTSQMIKQVSNNIDITIKNMEDIIDFLSYDPQVIKFLKDKGNNKTETDAVKDNITRTILRFVSINPDLFGVVIVNKNDDYVSDIMSRISRDPLTDESWYKQAVDNPNVFQLYSKPMGRNIFSILKTSEGDILSIAKAVRNTSTDECMGVILIDIKIDVIKHIIENVTLGKKGFLYVMDLKNEVVYAPVNPVVYRIDGNLVNEKGNTGTNVNIKDKSYELLYKNSDYTGWKTIGVFAADDRLKTVTDIRSYSLLIAFITLILAIVLALFFASSISNPISKLRNLMNRAEKGDFDVHFNSRYKDEIGELGNSFNNMVEKIKELIALVQKQEKNKMRAEIQLLQSQIKPHFLYNTLDTIQWMAQEHDAEDIVEIVTSLTSLLRIGLSKGEEIIKVSQEIEHVRSYLIIQKVRYEDKFDYEINLEQNMMNLNVIKLILQPLVENAIYHGIKEKRGKGKISISGEIKEGKLHFCVMDNGVGIKEDKLAEINKTLTGEFSPYSKIGFGIYNVNERIRLTYGDEYGLKYYSTFGEGTTVEIWHPII